MRSILHRAIIVLALVSLTATAAFARNKRATVTFSEDTIVNGTMVKKGDYEIKFDQTSNELLIRRHGKVVAQAAASTQPTGKKARETALNLANDGTDYKLISVAFSGSRSLVVLN
jgi:hypothetical protein